MDPMIVPEMGRKPSESEVFSVPVIAEASHAPPEPTSSSTASPSSAIDEDVDRNNSIPAPTDPGISPPEATSIGAEPERPFGENIEADADVPATKEREPLPT